MTPLLPFPGLPVRPVLVGPDEPGSVPVIPGALHVAIELDGEDGPARVTADDLEAWGTSMPALLGMAVTRLALASPRDQWLSVDPIPGMTAYRAADGRSASRLLILDQLVGSWPLGGVVVAVPAPDQLLAVGLDGLEDLEALQVLVVATDFAHLAAQEPITKQVFWTDGRRWAPVTVSQDGDEVVVELPAEARQALGRVAAMTFAVAGEA